MAPPILARDENHASQGNLCHEQRVMIGSADHLLLRQAQVLGSALHCLDNLQPEQAGSLPMAATPWYTQHTAKAVFLRFTLGAPVQCHLAHIQQG